MRGNENGQVKVCCAGCSCCGVDERGGESFVCAWAVCAEGGGGKGFARGGLPRKGRIYFVSSPENKLAISLWGWEPNIGHASLVTKDETGRVAQYDYGWFVGGGRGRPRDAIGYVDASESYGVVKRKTFSASEMANATNDFEVAKMVWKGMGKDPITNEPLYGNVVELWGTDVADVGIAERYMENFAADEERGSMAWRWWQIGGYRCGNITRQAFDAARGEGHFLDLLWGGFPGADAPSIGTEKTVFEK